MTKVFKVTPTEKMIGICHGSMLVSAMTETEAIDIFNEKYDDISIAVTEVKDLVYGGNDKIIENNIVFTSNYLESLV